VLAATLVAVALALSAQITHLLDRVEDEAIGVRFELRGDKPPSKVAVVAIDSATFPSVQEQWPFPRSMHARAIDRLREAGARVVVYDVQFTEPTTRREDNALARAIERMPGTVLATTETDGKGATNVLGGDDNLAAIGAQAAAANLVTEAGGVVKRFPSEVGGLRSIAAVAAEQMTGRVLENRDFEAGGAWIDFAGPRGTVPSVSFGDLLAGRADKTVLRDRVVVVGATAPTLRDVHTTPLSAKGLMSGPEIQANAISTALDGLPLRRAPGWIAILAIIAMGFAPALARRHVRGALVALLAALTYVVATQAAFESGHILPMTYPLLALALGTVGSIGTAFLTERRERNRVELRNDLLEQRVRERTEDLRATQMEIVQRLGQAAESRDEDTGEHIERISRLCHRLALATGLGDAEAELIGHASAMHDVGKIGIPDRVLLKPGRLDPEEWALMRTHTTIGGAILGGSTSRLLQVAESIAVTHHERWDGSGYPAGLIGEEIPLAARICAICDVYDALLSSRAYKPRWSLDQSLMEIERQRGRHFDPDLVDVFVRMVPTLDDDLRRGGEASLPGVLSLAASGDAPAPASPARPLPTV
jgi:response regulator RpfG family c-di-GMP phosphodiesterase